MKIKANPADDSLLARSQDILVNRMQEQFHSLRHNVSATKPWANIQTALQEAIVHFRVEGYRKGALAVGKSPISSDIILLRQEGVSRAAWVASEMKGWTDRSLRASKKSRLLSQERAAKVATFEARKAFFEGTLPGWKLSKVAEKSWLTSAEYHDIDDRCDDNEDDGIIAVTELFSTGDAAPPAHLWCYCSLWLHVR